MYIWMAAFSAGAILLYCTGELLAWPIYILAVFFLVVVVKPASFIIICFFALGHFYANTEAQHHLESILPKQQEEKIHHITAYLCSIPIQNELYFHAEFCVITLSSNDSAYKARFPQRFKLSWAKGLKLNFQTQLMALNVLLKRPHGSLNPVGGAYEKYLFFKRITATGKIVNEEVSLVKREGVAGLSLFHVFRSSLTSARIKIADYLDEQLIGLEHAGVLKALVVGEKSGISPDDHKLLKVSGTQHLMAISGLHVGVIMMLLSRMLPRKKSMLLIVFLGSFAYVILVGFGSSAQRALVMGLVGMMYVLGFFPSSRWRPYLLALFLVLVIDPLATLSLGFWFSFFCVAVLLFISRFLPLERNMGWGFILLQLLIVFALAPLNNSLGLAHGFSTLFANMIAIPIISLIVLPGVLLALVVSFLFQDLGSLSFVLLNEVLHFLMTYLSSLTNLTFQFFLPTGWWISVAYFACLVCSIILWRVKGVVASIALVIAVSFLLTNRRFALQDQLIVFDAGQGLALLLAWNEKVWLYDTGPSARKSSVAGSTILPFLRSKNASHKVQGIIVSHGDWDHASGLTELYAALSPSYIWAGEPERSPGIDLLEYCKEGMTQQDEGMVIDVLYPFDSDVKQTRSSNNHSCVVKVTVNAYSFLIMGDLEGEAELALVQRYTEKLKADVLIAGHHGSNNASSYALLKYVKPELVVFSSGYLNRFGHPGKEVLTRVKNIGASGYSTASTGALVFYLDEGSMDNFLPETQRNLASPFWISQ